MVLPFSCLPDHLQLDIVKKMEFRDFANLQQSSFDVQYVPKALTDRISLDIGTLSTCWGEAFFDNGKWRKRFTKKMLNYPVRFVFNKMIINDEISDKMLDRLIQLCEECQLVGNNVELFMRGFTSCDPERFDHFLRVINAKRYFEYLSSGTNVYFKQPTFRKLENITTVSPLCDNDLISLEAPIMSIERGADDVTVIGVNRFLKQWQAGERQITYSCIYTTFRTEDDVHLLSKIENTPLWSPKIHNKSLLAKLPVFEMWNYRKHLRMYSLIHGNQKLFAEVEDHKIVLREVPDVNEALFKMLEPAHFKVITGVCKKCQVQECSC